MKLPLSSITSAATAFRRTPTASAASVRRSIVAEWGAIVASLPKAMRNRMPESVPASPTLLGKSYKTELGESFGVLTAVIYLSPAGESGVTTCPDATPECASSCLGWTSGLLTTSTSKTSRLWKTGLLTSGSSFFGSLLRLEVEAHAKRARKLGLVPALRIDGSSDTGLGDLVWRTAAESGVIAYDYTKNVDRALRNVDRLTFSHSGPKSLDSSRAVLEAGGAVAVVFGTRKGEPLPSTWEGFRVVDGDISDDRFNDRERFGISAAEGYVVGLRFKGNARSRAGSFIAEVN